MTDKEIPLLPNPEDLAEHTREDFYCNEHRVIKLTDTLGRKVCPVCIVEATERLKYQKRETTEEV